MPNIGGFNWRANQGRRGRNRLPRMARLAISVAVLLLIVLGIVLLVRGCTSAPGGAPDPTTSAGTTTPGPDLGDPDEAGPNLADPSGTDPGPTEGPTTPGEADPVDPGTGGEDALDNIGEQQVDPNDFLEESPAPTVIPGNRSATIRSIGDIVAHVPILKAAYNQADSTYDFSPMFAQIAPSIAAADYTVLNVDGPMPGKKFVNGYKGYPQFNTPPYLLYALKDAGVDMLTLSNNHALDAYFDGLKATLDNVDKVGLDHIGTYRTQEEHDAPYIKEIGGIKVGFLNYTTGTNNMLKRSDPAAGEYGLRTTANSNAPNDIKALRNAGAEVVLVYMHWGTEYDRTITNDIATLARKLTAAGADVIIGGHQHVALPCAWVTAKDEAGQDRTALVLYGMGNFLSDQRARYRDSGLIFEFTLSDNPSTGKVEVTNPRYIPTYVHRTSGSSGGYDYQVLACGSIIENPPSSISSNVLNRIKQVWNEQKQLMEGGPATALKH